jgi:hypothetical protein
MNKEQARLTLSAGAVLIFLLGLQLLRAKAETGGQTDIDAAIESLRADVRADKTTVVGKAMALPPDQSEKFWPIYKQYEKDLSEINNERVEMVKQYAQKEGHLTDQEAKAMAEKSFDVDFRKADLRRRYFKRMDKELPATTVAKFFQLEHRLDLVVDAKLASELPPILEKSTAGPAPAPENK